ncbi:iron complex transport system substrate-binding protein [Pseudonocardia sediminis]|uniref:Iron complex transport system substrate-binding protein n=1 Tax=Pseudonocardia sediminis TaxID=1397368 RepID=A0A4V2FQ84_PSEST|nr:iron-siderophore ABC transporter substrate-binding protein [Pseudonocardia sediminis]RZT83790.1 iron complex transport system substrate-binding protein [Pseudonocardia sediminis]
MERFTRRQVLLGSLAAGGVLLTGCGGGDETSGGAAAGAGFPATIEHKFGTTTIERAPTRVVTVGYQEHDFVLALGVAPVGVRYWYGPENEVVYPWAKQAAQAVNANPAILNMDTIDPEKVAALRPDLILGTYSDLTQESYALLSKIAPTVGIPKGFNDYGLPWQDATRTIGTALGRSDRAEQLITDLDARFAAVRDANPQFAGKTVAVATYGANQLSVFASQDPRSRFFTSLGFVVPPRYDELSGTSFYAELSFERATELDQDLLVWDQISFTPGGRATIAANPLVQRLNATRAGHTVYIEGATELAFAWNSVLSLPSALDGIVPQLEKAYPKTGG